MEETTDGRKLTTILETDDQAESEQAAGACRGVRERNATIKLTKEEYQRKGRSVYVISVEEESGTSILAGDSWPSAVAASAALGYTKYNRVAIALSTAKGLGGKSITLKGVELCYAEDVPGMGRVD